MAEEITIARPYAEAVYNLAEQDNSFEKWSSVLQLAASVVANPDMRNVIGDPNLSAEKLEQLIFSIVEKQSSDAQVKNFIHVLVENNRLLLLPHIATLFEELKAQREGVLEAQIHTAFGINDAEVQDLVKRLEGRFKRKIEPNVIVDPSLIGGVKIVIGDVVVDASVQGQLQNMSFALRQ